MLPTPTPFPQVGSYCLVEAEGDTLLARIIARDAQGNATISFPDRVGASGNKSVPLSELLDGTPLGEAERSEYEALARGIAAARPRRAAVARCNQLRLRDIYAEILALRLARLDKKAAA